jgi:hypothetical protein
MCCLMMWAVAVTQSLPQSLCSGRGEKGQSIVTGSPSGGLLMHVESDMDMSAHSYTTLYYGHHQLHQPPSEHF